MLISAVYDLLTCHRRLTIRHHPQSESKRRYFQSGSAAMDLAAHQFYHRHPWQARESPQWTLCQAPRTGTVISLACHKKTGPPIFGSPRSKYIEIFGPPG